NLTRDGTSFMNESSCFITFFQKTIFARETISSLFWRIPETTFNVTEEKKTHDHKESELNGIDMGKKFRIHFFI
ncbi:hypothetical protein L9F63_011689, partial [Diploptera punctata]